MCPLYWSGSHIPPLIPGAHTPELQPAERPWRLTDEAVANKPFETVDDLADTRDRRCSTLADDPETIRPTTRFNQVASGMNHPESGSELQRGGLGDAVDGADPFEHRIGKLAVDHM